VPWAGAVGRHATDVCRPSQPIRSIAVILVQVILYLGDAMSTINPNDTTTWSYFSSLWSALKLNFAEWQNRALSRRLTRIAADIEANNVPAAKRYEK
jgi:hypothetical protein